MKHKKKIFSLKRIIIFCLLFIIISCSILLYSHYIGTSGLITNEFNIKYSSISENIYGLKIVHISDIHYGTVNEEELQNLVKKINLTKPDIVVFTGDLIDSEIDITSEEEQMISNYLNEIDANIGKYTIKGNEDIKNKNWDIIMENGGFINLNDNYKNIYFNDKDYILLVGMSSNYNNSDKINDKIKETLNDLETSEKKPNYSILIMHEPDFIDSIDYSKFNLVLAGHSHNGQIIIPGIGGIIKPKYAQKYNEKYYKLNTTEFYISGGLGTSQIDFRLFNRPSFNLYRLVN